MRKRPPLSIREWFCLLVTLSSFSYGLLWISTTKAGIVAFHLLSTSARVASSRGHHIQDKEEATMTREDREKRKSVIERDAQQAMTQAKQIKAITIEGHPMDSYNGEYVYVDSFEGFPYYKSAKNKFLFHPVPVGWADIEPMPTPLRCPECTPDFDPADYEGMEPIGPGTDACNSCTECPEHAVVDMAGSNGCVCEQGYLGDIQFDDKHGIYGGFCEATPHDMWVLNRIFDPDSAERNAWVEAPGGAVPMGPNVWYHRIGSTLYEYHITAGFV